MNFLPKNIITKFENLTKFNLKKFLLDYDSFIENDKQNILDYYNGFQSKPSKFSFNKLKYLLSKYKELNDIMNYYSYNLKTADYWELYDFLTDLFTSLETIENSSKWLRSSITKNNFSPNIEVDKYLKQNQTLESLSNELGSKDKDNYWLNIALRNDLKEEDYELDGGQKLFISFRNKKRIIVETVVDNIFGEKIYGKDIQRKLEFYDNDLKHLSYKETIIQTVFILANLKRNDTPEFPEDGLQLSLVNGINRNSLNYHILLKQFFKTFSKDDTLKHLTITNIVNSKDSLSLEFTVTTRLDETIVQKIELI